MPIRISRRALITIGISSGILLSALDTYIIGTAMPTVVASLGGTELYSWVFAAYLLAFTTATPIFGKLSDLYGQKKLFTAGIVVFLIGSVLCGASQTMIQLIIFRALQGLGAGGITAMAFTIIGHVFEPTERPKMQAVLGSMWAISSVLGPGIGGFIVDYFSWRWTFYVNVPISIIPAALVLVSLHDARRPDRKPAIDFAGALSLAGCILSLLFALLQGETIGWTSPLILGLFATSALLLLLFIWSERRAPEPIVPLSLFRIRTFTLCNLENVLAGAALLGILAFIPLFVQGVLSGSATAAGMAVMPLGLGWPLGNFIAGYVVNRLGYRNTAIAGMTLLVTGFYLLVGMSFNSSPDIIGRNMFIAGLGMGALTPTMTAAVQNAVPRAHMGVASSSIVFYRNIGGSVGVSFLGAILNSQMGVWTSQLIDNSLIQSLPATATTSLRDPQVLLRPELSAQLPPAIVYGLQQSLLNSIHTIFIVSLLMLSVGLVISLFLPNSTPAKDVERMANARNVNPRQGTAASHTSR